MAWFSECEPVWLEWLVVPAETKEGGGIIVSLESAENGRSTGVEATGGYGRLGGENVRCGTDVRTGGEALGLAIGDQGSREKGRAYDA